MDELADPRDRGRDPVSGSRALKVGVFYIRSHKRSRTVCDAFCAGIRAGGDEAFLRFEDTWTVPVEPDFDAVVFYGLEGRMRRIFQFYRGHRVAVYVDLGYWGRREGGRWAGYHKVCVNARHPVAYFRKPQHPLDRLRALNITPTERHDHRGEFPDKYILLAGMGDKGALFEGFAPEVWERWAIAEIKKHTERPILYRPKPSWRFGKPIEGTLFSDPKKFEVEQELARAFAVVTHHSNVAVDALVAGIPAFSWGGVARELSLQDLSMIETPVIPSLAVRAAWMADLAYTQWTIEEMKRGLPWAHLKREGFL